MQCSAVNELTTGDWGVLRTPVPNCGEQLQIGQIVAHSADKLTILPRGEMTPREVPRSAVESHQAVYGTATPQQGVNPIVVQDRR